MGIDVDRLIDEAEVVSPTIPWDLFQEVIASGCLSWDEFKDRLAEDSSRELRYECDEHGEYEVARGAEAVCGTCGLFGSARIEEVGCRTSK